MWKNRQQFFVIFFFLRSLWKHGINTSHITSARGRGWGVDVLKGSRLDLYIVSKFVAVKQTYILQSSVWSRLESPIKIAMLDNIHVLFQLQILVSGIPKWGWWDSMVNSPLFPQVLSAEDTASEIKQRISYYQQVWFLVNQRVRSKASVLGLVAEIWTIRSDSEWSCAELPKAQFGLREDPGINVSRQEQRFAMSMSSQQELQLYRAQETCGCEFTVVFAQCRPWTETVGYL